MLRNSPSSSMHTEDGGYQQYPMTGQATNGGYNYYLDRQYYDLEKGYTVLNTIFNTKITLPLGFTYHLISLRDISSSTTATSCRLLFRTLQQQTGE